MKLSNKSVTPVPVLETSVMQLLIDLKQGYEPYSLCLVPVP